MDERIQWLYEKAYGFTEQEIYREELFGQVQQLESMVWDVLDRLNDQDRAVLEGYLSARDELEFQTVKLAYLRGKSLGGNHSDR